MTLDDHLSRLRYYIESIAAKAGAHERGPLEVALSDHRSAADAVTQIGVELARRYERARR